MTRPINPLLYAILYNPSPSGRIREVRAALANSSGYTLLVPKTSILEWSVDKDSLLPLRDLCLQDDFVLSHIIQSSSSDMSSDLASPRSRARYFGTLNGKTVIIKGKHIHTHKGFRRVCRVDITREYVLNPGSDDLPLDIQLLIYELDQPLVGTAIPSLEVSHTITAQDQVMADKKPAPKDPESLAKPRDLEALLTMYPKVSRQLFGPLLEIVDGFDVSTTGSSTDLKHRLNHCVYIAAQTIQAANENSGFLQAMAAETELDSDQLSDLIHKYIESNLSHKLWLRLTDLGQAEDSEFVRTVRSIRHLDISQVGLPLDLNLRSVLQLDRLVGRAVVEFNGLTEAASCEDKIAVLLRVVDILSNDAIDLNADALVSLLVLVVARANVTHVKSHLSYIQNFTYRDISSGHLGYALLTLEGVIFHIEQETAKMSQLSQANEAFWDCCSQANGETVKATIADLQTTHPDDWVSIVHSRNCSQGLSALMMALQRGDAEVAEILLQAHENDPPKQLQLMTQDHSLNGSTLLMLAVQSEHGPTIELVLTPLLSLAENLQIAHLARTDEFQRTVAHYFFHAPWLVDRLGSLVAWDARDHNGQTPLFAICRSYDHPQFQALVEAALHQTGKSLGRVSVLDHLDAKGNSLLHIAKDKHMLQTLLAHDMDVNWPNIRGLTPLMVFSRYSRLDAIRLLLDQPVTDMDRVDDRDLSALDMAKDLPTQDLLEHAYLQTNQDTIDESGRHLQVSIPRSQFVDGDLWFVVRTQSRAAKTTTTSTVRRTFGDFLFLQKWLAYENPFSWIPTLKTPRNPFVVPYRPCRPIIDDVRFRLNSFLRVLLSHPTFAAHELLWEFLLIQDFSKSQSIDRCRRKLQSHKELQFEYGAGSYSRADLPPIRVFFQHAGSEIGQVHRLLARATRLMARLRLKQADLSEAYHILEKNLAEAPFVQLPLQPSLHHGFGELDRPAKFVVSNLISLTEAAAAVESALAQPLVLIADLESRMDDQWRNRNHLETMTAKKSAWAGLFVERRARELRDTEDKVYLTDNEIRRLGSDVRSSHEMAAYELGGFYGAQETELRWILGKYARDCIRDCRERRQRLERLVK